MSNINVPHPLGVIGDDASRGENLILVVLGGVPEPFGGAHGDIALQVDAAL
jgi:hypothetical protein